MPQIEANGIALEYEDYGDKSAPPLLLVMGLGAQLTLWPIELVEALVERGFRVIRYDNRDIGLSGKIEGAKAPGMVKLLLLSKIGLRPRVPTPSPTWRQTGSAFWTRSASTARISSGRAWAG